MNARHFSEGRGMEQDKLRISEWLTAAKAGDDEAFGLLVRAYYPSLFRLVYQMVPCAQDVEDILQDALFRFYRAMKRVRDGEDPFPFLRTIVVRRTYSFLKHRRSDSVSLSDLPEDLPHLAAGGRTLEVGVLYRLAYRLPPQQRFVFLMRDVLGVDDREIARLLGLREPTVRRHASLARESLERMIREGA
jgi:RNA polymerase sigma-70 factor (ECF subfamily)